MFFIFWTIFEQIAISLSQRITICYPNRFLFYKLQVTKQGMEMAAEGALMVSPNLGSCAIDSTFTAQVEQRNVKEVRKFA